MDPRALEEIYEGFHDDATFCRESQSVQDKLGRLVPCELGPAQLKLYRLIQDLKAKRKPIRILCLKARQVWISTYIAARFSRDTPHRSGQQTLVLAHDKKTALNLFSYYERFYKTYKPFRGVISLPKGSPTGEELAFDNSSWIKVHTAGNANIGRSFVLRRVHFSEFAFYPDSRNLMAAVMAAVPGDLDTEVFVETTANGVGNEFHQMWQRAVSGESEWIPYFFAWWEHPEYVRAIEVTREQFERSLTQAEREMRQAYNLTHEQLNWRRYKIRNDLNGDEALFRQEYPGNPEEAFLTSGRPRFDHKTVQRQPIVREALTGQLEMEEYGGRKKILFLPKERGDLVIYRKPQENREYMCGADVAEGLDINDGKGTPDPDWCVAQVHDRETGEQVARFRARITPAEFGWQLFLLLAYYNWAQIVPEANGPGLAAIDALLAHRYPADLIYHRIRTADQDPKERADLIGWKTTQVTRPQMISLLDDALRQAAILIHDPITQSELFTFVIKVNGRAEHQTSCHDDCVIAEALSVVGMVQMPAKKRQRFGPIDHAKVHNYKQRDDHRDERGTLHKL